MSTKIVLICWKGENVKPMLKMKAGDTKNQLTKYAARYITVGATTEITDRVTQ